MAGWLAGRFAGWLVGWMSRWLVALLAGWLAGSIPSCNDSVSFFIRLILYLSVSQFPSPYLSVSFRIPHQRRRTQEWLREHAILQHEFSSNPVEEHHKNNFTA